MISVNLTVEQLEAVHAALFFATEYHEEVEYIGDENDPSIALAAAEVQQIRVTALDTIEETLGKVLELVPTSKLEAEKFYLVDRSEVYGCGLERVVAGPFSTQDECTAERLGWHDGRHIVVIQCPPNPAADSQG